MREWNKKKFGDLGQTYTGLSGKSRDDFGSGMPYIPYMNIFTNSKIDPTYLDYVKINFYEKQNVVKSGDIFFTTSSETVEEVGMTSVLLEDIGEAYLNSFCFGFRLFNFDDLLPEFVPYLFRGETVRKSISILGQGSTRYNLPKKELLNRLFLFLPSLSEQRKIARILSTADVVIEATRAAIAKYKAIKQGMLHDLFTRGIDPRTGTLRPTFDDAPELYRDSLLGRVPKEWEVTTVENLFEMILGKMLNAAAKSGEDQFPYLANRNVLWDSVDLSDLDTMNFSDSERQRLELKFGDLLICEGGAVGRTSMWRGEMSGCYFQKAIHRLRAKQESIIPQYMLAYMKFADEKGFLTNYISQTSIAHLTQEKLALLPIILPEHTEQNEIVNRVTVFDAKIQIEQNYLLKMHSIKSGLMGDLLSGRKRLNQDLQD